MDVKGQLSVYEEACSAYARYRKTEDPRGCDRAAMVAAFLTIKAAFDPQVSHVIYHEGEEWTPFEPRRRMAGPIHAFKCSDGRVWDVCNGWRT